MKFHITRQVEPLSRSVKPGKVLVVYGPRRVGKTTLLQKLPEELPNLRYRMETGDDISIQAAMSDLRVTSLARFAEGLDLLIIDEAQFIPNIGQVLKILVDHRPDLRLVVSGSASFEIANQIGEPLTGRHSQIILYPISQQELLHQNSPYELEQQLSNILTYGSYPEIIGMTSAVEKREYLERLVNSYLLKDILAFEKVRSPQKVLDLLRLVAYQVGNEVSYSELATQLGMSVPTVQRYLDLFEKGFILFRLSGYSSNLRSEITRKHKYYFYDTGIRNAIVANFSELTHRNDIGAVWENFCMVERRKLNSYGHRSLNSYFWRTYQGHEIDYIEERSGQLYAYECKYNPRKPWRPPAAWAESYPRAKNKVITPTNYLGFVSDIDDIKPPLFTKENT